MAAQPPQALRSLPNPERMSIEVPDAFLEAVARRVAEMLAAQDQGPEPWLTVVQAAEHLACPKSRIYALTTRRGRDRIPHQKDGSRLLFRASELDAWLESGGGTRL